MRISKPAAVTLLVGAICAGPAGAADIENGKKAYKVCKACHTLVEGRRKIGPSLHGIFGRKAGTRKGFRYSRAMKDAGVTWTEETMRDFLRKPRQYIKGTRMSFAGVKSDEDLDDLIAYLKQATR